MFNGLFSSLEAITNMPSLSLAQQTAALIGAVVVSTGAGGSVALWIVDQRMDEKFATDVDVNLVRVSVHQNQDKIEEIKESQDEQEDKLDYLTLIVLDGQISALESEIRALESKESLTDQEIEFLSQQRRKLRDLELRRQRAFEETMEPN